MAVTDSGEKLKVFISYSRRDSTAFADELVDGLELAGFAPFLDRHDIAPGEKWEERLGGLIAQADTVVFVVSPEAVRSERCAWEVEQTLRQSKRLLPVVFKPVTEADIPEQLQERQFVRFDLAPGITRPLRELAEALRHDIDWIREHTRIGDMAARWRTRGRLPSLLLRGDDVVAAEVWMKNRKPGAPAISDAMQAFIAASKEADAAFLMKASAAEQKVARSRRLVAVVAATFVAVLIVGLVGWIKETTVADGWRFLTVTWPYERAHVRPYALGAVTEQALKPGDTFRECAPNQQDADYCPDMVVVPSGLSTMGGSTQFEQPQHLVTFSKPFAVAKDEVTFAEWDACVAGGGCNGYKPADQGWGRGQQPVINVNWEDARQYVAWLSEVTGKTYRLLSEAEYEYSTRAGTMTTYSWGDDIKLNGQAMANCNGCGSKWDNTQTAPVGSFPPNKFGLYDMVGNVFEWTEDCVHTNYNGAPADGSAWIAGGDCTNRMLRGASWRDTPDDLRSASRDGFTSGSRYVGIGFRVVRTLAP